jgi:SAM-dependent methyltransferase
MGVCWHHVKALISAYKGGMKFGRTITIGRLNLFIAPHELKQLLERTPELLERYDQFLGEHPKYAEPLFKLLGASEVLSMDASDYEAATTIHDLNLPIPAELKSSFDLVDDGGTLEHVFNFPTAIRNCMEMVKVGGHLLINTPANNLFGHGFYQFSPELFFRVLCPEYGFEVERMVAFEQFDGSQWFEIADPDVVHSRVELINRGRPVMLSIRARKTREAEIFARFPQQSDYSTAWEASAGTDTGSIFLEEPNRLRAGIKKTLGRLAPRLLLNIRRAKCARVHKRFSFEKQRPYFTPVDD